MTRASVPMSARPKRSAWGFGIVSRDDWRLRAACRGLDPEVWSARNTRRLAVHICHTHCAALEQCRAVAEAQKPYDVVQGGIVWAASYGDDRIDMYPPPWHRKCRLCTVDESDGFSSLLPDHAQRAHAGIGEASGV